MRVTRHGAMQFRADHQHANCQVPGCHNAGTWTAEIAGYPAGGLCESHRREWVRAWDGTVLDEQRTGGWSKRHLAPRAPRAKVAA